MLFFAEMREPADYAIGSAWTDEGVAERIKLYFLKIIGVSGFALLLLIFLAQRGWVEEGRANV